ncbi:MAG TPA: hypothetical protein VHW03_05110 [Chthoniobacterales bacterium]|nr:hypothetical protein [Chthoniobacterales bacterium]
MPNDRALPMPLKETIERARFCGRFIALMDRSPRGEVKTLRGSVPGVASAR